MRRPPLRFVGASGFLMPPLAPCPRSRRGSLCTCGSDDSSEFRRDDIWGRKRGVPRRGEGRRRRASGKMSSEEEEKRLSRSLARARAFSRSLLFSNAGEGANLRRQAAARGQAARGGGRERGAREHRVLSFFWAVQSMKLKRGNEKSKTKNRPAAIIKFLSRSRRRNTSKSPIPAHRSGSKNHGSERDLLRFSSRGDSPQRVLLPRRNDRREKLPDSKRRVGETNADSSDFKVDGSFARFGEPSPDTSSGCCRLLRVVALSFTLRRGPRDAAAGPRRERRERRRQ